MASYGQYPFGLREVKVVVNGVAYPLPVAQTLGLEPTFESADLKGDDITVLHLSTLQSVKITVKNGGLPLEAWTALLSGTKTITNSGLSNEVTTMTLAGGETTATCKIYGRIQGAAGDNTHVKFFKAYLDTSKLDLSQANFAGFDATFVAVQDPGTSKLFEILQNKTSAALPAS